MAVSGRVEEVEAGPEAVEREPERKEGDEQHATPTRSARFRATIRGEGTSGASAISVAARTLDPIAAHASGAPWFEPPRTGAIEKASVPTAATQKPAASSRSSMRPSTEKRTPARIATIVAARTTAVSSTRRPSGSSYVLRRIGFVRKSAVAEPRSATSSSSPTSHASKVSFGFFVHVPLIGKQTVCR